MEQLGQSRISLDPGLGGTGLAVWDEATWRACVEPKATAILLPEYKDGRLWIERCNDLAGQLFFYLRMHKCRIVYCEFPMKFDGAVGVAAISGQVSDIAKLTFLIGTFSATCHRYGAQFIDVPVNQWKGQLSKEAVANRIASRLEIHPNKYPSHANDAVGIGLWAKGVFSANT